MTEFNFSPIILFMTKSELPNPNFRNDRIIPNFKITSKIWEKELPRGAAEGYTWVYVPDGELLRRDQEQIMAENSGVLQTVVGEVAWEPILLPRVYGPTGIGGSESHNQRILVPQSIAKTIAGLDSGKIDQRDTLSKNHSALFLEATVGVLDDIVNIVELSLDPDLLNFEFAQHFRFMMENAADMGEEEKAREYIRKITSELGGQPLDQFSIVLSGLRTTILLKGKPFFTNYYGADDIVRKMISNDLLPAFVKGMDQKNVWFRADAAKTSAFDLPEFSEDDLLIQECRKSGFGSDIKKLIEAYISGDLGVGFINRISEGFIADLKERRLQGALGDEDGRKALAEQMRMAMMGASNDLSEELTTVMYDAGQSDEQGETHDDLEEDSDVARRIRQLKKKKPLDSKSFED